MQSPVPTKAQLPDPCMPGRWPPPLYSPPLSLTTERGLVQVESHGVCLCDWLASLGVMSSRVTCVAACVRMAFLLKDGPTTRLDHVRLICPLICCRALGLLPLLAVVSDAAWTQVQERPFANLLSVPRCAPRSGTAGSPRNTSFTHCFPPRLRHSTFTSKVHRVLISSHHCQHCYSLSLSLSLIAATLAGAGFHLHFPTDQ